MSKRAIITGVSGAIGSAIAEHLQDQGWSVSGVDIKGAPPPVGLNRFIQCDIASALNFEAAVRALSGASLDLLVNNAVAQIKGSAKDTSLEDWDRSFAVNVRAAFIAVKATISALVSACGTVMNIGSVHTTARTPGRVAYVSSKGALSGFTRACALELAQHGIRVNTVAPGAVDTPMLHRAMADGSFDQKSSIENTPLKRTASPEEVARVVAFLVCDDTGFITRQELVIAAA